MTLARIRKYKKQSVELLMEVSLIKNVEGLLVLLLTSIVQVIC